MPNINDVFPSKYLKSHELKGHTPTVTIERVALEQVRNRAGKLETKPVVYFRGKEKGALINKTCAQAIAAIAGSPETEAWSGVAVTIYASTATFGAEKHAVIRFRAPATAAAPRPRVADVTDIRRRPTTVPAILTGADFDGRDEQGGRR
jgi:hypothetical protein